MPQGGKYQPRNFSVNDLVRNLISSKVMPHDAQTEIISTLGEDVHLALVDVTQITMVLDAVFTNACEALQQKGIIQITTALRPFAEMPAGIDDIAKHRDYIFIGMEDNGPGMNEETLSRIFEPFFTTKIYGRGLGMAAAYGIVRNHDGMITVESAVGRGTKVMIYLPAAGNPGKAG